MTVPAAPAPGDDEPVVILDARSCPRLIARLVAYSQGRLAAGVGVDRLQAGGLALPALRDLYGIGYLPEGFTEALTSEEAASLDELDLANSFVLPAFDAAGAPVDMDVWSLDGSPHFRCHVVGVDRAILAPRLAAVDVPPTLVDDLGELGRRVAAGDQHVLLLRPAVPIAAQLTELRSRGLAKVGLGVADAIALDAACRAVGLEVEDRLSVEAWSLAHVDRDHHRAVFRSGDLTVSVETPWRDTTRLRIEARHGDGRHQGDDVDLAAKRQRASFARVAGRKLGVAAAHLLLLLDDALLARLQRIESGESPLAVEARSTGPVADVLSEPDIVGRFQRDLEALGWVGDERAKHLGLLVLAGRTLAQPPWLVLRGPPQLTLPALGILADLAPADHLIQLARSVEGGLAHLGRDGLRHRLLVCDDATVLRPATITALQVIQARGGLAVPTAVRDDATGRMASRLSECRGPVGFLAAATNPGPIADLAIVAPLDASPAQTARAIAAAQRRAEEGASPAVSASIRAAWMAALAALPVAEVRIPGAQRVEFPSRLPRHRVEMGWLLNLAAAGALIHHRHRERAGKAILATDADIEAAIAATAGILGGAANTLSRRAADVLDLMKAATSSDTTLPEVMSVFPAWTRSEARLAVEELLDMGIVASPPVGRGRKARVYSLVAGGEPAESPIRLRPQSPQEMAGVVIGTPLPRASITPVRQAV